MDARLEREEAHGGVGLEDVDGVARQPPAEVHGEQGSALESATEGWGKHRWKHGWKHGGVDEAADRSKDGAGGVNEQRRAKATAAW